MSIEPSDWFNRFFGANWPFRRSNPFEGFEEMRREMEREFEENLRDIELSLVWLFYSRDSQ
jgi:hypothetical protein